MAPGFVERLQRIGQDMAQQHIADQRLPADQKQPFALVVGLRAWWFAALQELRRKNGDG